MNMKHHSIETIDLKFRIEIHINQLQSQTKQKAEFSWRGALKENDPNSSSVAMQHQIVKDWGNHE